MQPFVLDASATMPWCFDDETSPYTEELLNWCAAGTDAYVASVWPLEISNVLIWAERTGRVTEARIEQFLEQLMELPIHVEPSTTEQALQDVRKLARLHRLTAYDAAYLELAIRKSSPLASLDENLKRTAQSSGVKLAGS